METIQMQLIGAALKKYEKIYPVASRASLQQCFTRYGRRYVFWFNTEDHSTHIETVTLSDDRVAECVR